MGMNSADTSTPLRLTQATSFNDAIKSISEGDTGAATIVASLNSQYPKDIMELLHDIDRKRIYGHDLYLAYWDECNGSLAHFLALLKA